MQKLQEKLHICSSNVAQPLNSSEQGTPMFTDFIYVKMCCYQSSYITIICKTMPKNTHIWTKAVKALQNFYNFAIC